MGKKEKLVKRIKSKPKDFTWGELVSLLNYFGYEEIKGGKTSGSRVKFINKINTVISLHRPHPSNELKTYQINQVLDQFKIDGLL